MKLRIVLAALLVLTATVYFQASVAQAQQYFSLSSGTPTWDDGITPNWSSVSDGPYNAPWVDDNDAHFEGTGGSVDVNGAIGSAAGLFFNVGGYSLNPDPENGGSLSFLGSDGITTAAGAAAAINVPLTLGSSQTWTTGSGGTLTIGNNIFNGTNLLTIAGAGQTIINGGLGNGSGGLTMQGPGTLLLGGANTYSGTMTLASGTLDIDSPTALGTSRLVINGGTIDNTSGSALALSPSIAMTWNSGFTFLGSSDLNLGSGSIANLTATPTINVASGVLTVGGALASSNQAQTAGLTKTGTGILAFSNTSNGLSYSGTTNIMAGTLENNGHNGVDTKTFIALCGGVYQIYNPNSQSLTESSIRFGTSGGGNLDWTTTGTGGGFAARGGPVTINLNLPNAVKWGSQAGFLGTGQSLIFGSPDSNALVNLQGNINLNGAQRTVYVYAGQSGSMAELSQNITDSASGNHGGIYKDGAGSLILAGINTFTGPTEVHAGELYLNNNDAVGSGATITVDAGATLGGQANLTSRNPTVNIAAGGGIEGGQSGTGSLTLPNATFTGSGSVTVPVTLPSLYLDQSTGVGLSVGVLSTSGGSAGTVVNVSGAAYPTFQGTTPTTVHLVKYTTLAGAGANFVPGNLNLMAPLGVGGVSLVNNTAQGYIDLSYYTNYAVWTGTTSGNLGDPNNFARLRQRRAADLRQRLRHLFRRQRRLGQQHGHAHLHNRLQPPHDLFQQQQRQLHDQRQRRLRWRTSSGHSFRRLHCLADDDQVRHRHGNVFRFDRKRHGIHLLEQRRALLADAGFDEIDRISDDYERRHVPMDRRRWNKSTTLGADSQFFDITGDESSGDGPVQIANGVTATFDTQDNNVNLAYVFGAAPNGSAVSNTTSTGGINKIGTGTLILNTSQYFPSYTRELYSGGTTITQGVLSFTTGVLNGTGPITMNGGVLQWNNNNGANSSNGANSTDVSSQLVMLNGITATLDLNGNTVNFATSIGSSSSASLVQVGNGFLTLQAPSTYTGTTTVSSGTLEVAVPAALPNYATSGSVTVGSGATVAVMTGGSAGWSGGQIDSLRTAAVWSDNTSTLGIDTTNGNFIYASIIDQPLSLNKMGANTLTLTASSTYSGATSVTGGTLQVGTPNALPTGTAVTLANAAGVAMDLHGFGQTIGSLSGGGPNGGNVTLGGGTLTVGNASSTTYSGAISGNGALVVQGNGTLALTGTHSYSGPTIINSGTLMLQPTNTLFFSAPLAYTFGNGAVNNGTQNVTSFTSGSPTISALGGPAPGLGYVSLNGSQYVEIDATTSALPNLSGSANYSIGMWIQTITPGSEFLYKGNPNSWDQGAEAFYLSGASSSGGAGNVIGGVQNSYGWIGGSVNVATGNWMYITLVRSNNTTTFYVNGVPDPQTATNMSGQEDGIQTIRIGWTNDPQDGPVNFVGSISGVTVFSSALTQTQIQNLMQPALSNLLPATTPVTIAAGATLDLGGAYQQVASLSDASPGSGGNVINSSQILYSTLVLSPTGGSSTFSGDIGGGPGALALVMSGAGEQVLSGENTYTGGTFVLDGTLVVTSDEGLLDGSSLTVGNPAAFFGTAAPAEAAAGAAATVPVPEPGTLVLIAAGGALILGCRWRRLF